jgi:hypothetical protein
MSRGQLKRTKLKCFMAVECYEFSNSFFFAIGERQADFTGSPIKVKYKHKAEHIELNDLLLLE